MEGAVTSHSADVLASAVAATVFVARCAFMQGGTGGGGGACIGACIGVCIGACIGACICMYGGIIAGYGAAYTGGAV